MVTTRKNTKNKFSSTPSPLKFETKLIDPRKTQQKQILTVILIPPSGCGLKRYAVFKPFPRFSDIRLRRPRARGRAADAETGGFPRSAGLGSGRSIDIFTGDAKILRPYRGPRFVGKFWPYPGIRHLRRLATGVRAPAGGQRGQSGIAAPLHRAEFQPLRSACRVRTRRPVPGITKRPCAARGRNRGLTAIRFTAVRKTWSWSILANSARS